MMDWENQQTTMATSDSMLCPVSGEGGNVPRNNNNSEIANVTAIRGNLYTIYQLIEFTKYYGLMATRSCFILILIFIVRFLQLDGMMHNN